jgi:signal transduction histidine kinase
MAPRRFKNEREGRALGERLATLGLVTAGVAHELASPVTALVANLGHALAGLAELNASGADPDPRLVAIQGAVRDALDAAERIRTISLELRSLARAPAGAAQPVAVANAVGRALAIVRGAVLPRARLEHDLAPLPPVRGDEGRLVQVLINLLVNAAHAIPPGARERHRVMVVARQGNPGQVVLEVSDTGEGIPPEILPRVFEPFFTTKDDGLGLGLSVCRDLVAAMGGELQIDSRPGLGTTARVVLPVCAS